MNRVLLCGDCRMILRLSTTTMFRNLQGRVQAKRISVLPEASFFYSLWSDWFTPFSIEANFTAITPSQSSP